MGAITLPIHTIPFFVCVRAIVNNNFIIAFFAALWLTTLGCSIASPFFIHATHIGDTNECSVTATLPYSAGIVSVAVHNTITFFIVSLDLMMKTQLETWSGRFNAFLHIKSVGAVSNLLMETGHLFVVYVLLL